MSEANENEVDGLVSVRPEHGQERNRHMHREQTTSNFETADGKPFEVTYFSSELSVAEKYCKHCDEWVSTKPLGIMGFAWCPKCMNYW